MNLSFQSLAPFVGCALLSATLQGCGGGSGPSPAPTPSHPTSIISVQEGGSVLLSCNVSVTVGCVGGPGPAGAGASGYVMTAWVDGKGHSGKLAPYNGTHCRCTLPAADAEAPVDVSFLEAPVNVFHVAGRVQYVSLWTPSLSKRPYLSSDKFAALVLGIHASVVDAFVS